MASGDIAWKQAGLHNYHFSLPPIPSHPDTVSPEEAAQALCSCEQPHTSLWGLQAKAVAATVKGWGSWGRDTATTRQQGSALQFFMRYDGAGPPALCCGPCPHHLQEARAPQTALPEVTACFRQTGPTLRKPVPCMSHLVLVQVAKGILERRSDQLQLTTSLELHNPCTPEPPQPY